jgi:hypothetical protein
LTRLPNVDLLLSATVLPEVDERVEVELFDILRVL